ncbi:MAG TPA: DUF1330 domain-containing protein [Spirochaetota bacterium]|nr:DUF1330 domain-containing protein [Spirochaetota bacterium]
MDRNLPTAQQLDDLRNLPADTPFVMVNLLRYRDHADGTSGAAAYQRYANVMLPMLAECGARVLWAGKTKSVFIGGEDDRWDSVLLVEYPSAEAFLEMVSSPAYASANEDRLLAVERTVLMVTQGVGL